MTTAPWDPAKYLKFADERARPVLDLLARVPAETPQTVFDLGCGPGNVTALLARRWPGARVIGVDRSEAMLIEARAHHPGIEFVAADLATFRPEAPADVIVANAALHWLSGHAGLFPALGRALAPNGALAVQMPHADDQPSHVLMAESAKSGPWRACRAIRTTRPRIITAGSQASAAPWTSGRRSISTRSRAITPFWNG